MINLDGAGEFLDAWLLLMEKLTNPKNILDSPYVFGVKSSEPAVFSPLQYLVQIQKVRLPCLAEMSPCNTLCTHLCMLEFFCKHMSNVSPFFGNINILNENDKGYVELTAFVMRVTMVDS